MSVNITTHIYAWAGIAITALAPGTVFVTKDMTKKKLLIMSTYVKVSNLNILVQFMKQILYVYNA